MNNDPSSDKSKQTDDENAAVKLNKFTHSLDIYQVKRYESDKVKSFTHHKFRLRNFRADTSCVQFRIRFLVPHVAKRWA